MSSLHVEINPNMMRGKTDVEAGKEILKGMGFRYKLTYGHFLL